MQAGKGVSEENVSVRDLTNSLLLHWPRLAVRFGLKDLEREFDQTEDGIRALQSVGQIIAELLKPLDAERCELCEGGAYAGLAVCSMSTRMRQLC